MSNSISMLWIISLVLVCLIVFCIIYCKRNKQATNKKTWLNCLLVGILLIFGYYILVMNDRKLTKHDKNLIGEGYVLRSDLDQMLKEFKNSGSIDTELTQSYKRNLVDISSYLSSFEHQKSESSALFKRDKTLNNYYSDLAKIGKDLSTRMEYLTPQSRELDTFFERIKDLKEQESDIFKYYRIDECFEK